MSAIINCRNQGGCDHRPHTGLCCQTSAALVCKTYLDQHIVKSRHSRIQIVIFIDELAEQVFCQARKFGSLNYILDLQPKPGCANRNDMTIFGQKTASVVDQRGALHD